MILYKYFQQNQILSLNCFPTNKFQQNWSFCPPPFSFEFDLALNDGMLICCEMKPNQFFGIIINLFQVYDDPLQMP